MNEETCIHFWPEKAACRLSWVGSFTCWFEGKQRDASTECDCYKGKASGAKKGIGSLLS